MSILHVNDGVSSTTSRLKVSQIDGDLIGMGSLDHKNFGALQPQFWRARTATEWRTGGIGD